MRDDACSEALVEPEVRVVQTHQPEPGVHRALGSSLYTEDVVSFPERGELRGGAVETVDEGLPGGIVDVLGHGGAVLGDHPADRLVPVDDDVPPAVVGERKPQTVAVFDRDRL